jgi:hypothetical protein
LLIAVAVLAVVGASVALVADLRSSDEEAGGRSGSERLDDGPPVRIVRTPAAFRVVYRLEEPAGGGRLALSTDRVVVRRPFDSRIETRRGAPPGDALVTTQVAVFGRLAVEGQDGRQSTEAVPPAVGASDIRLAPVLQPALDRGLLRRRERRRVADRTCQVYRSGRSLGAGPLVPPTGATHTDSCVDEAGLVLEEVVVDGGERLSRRVAVEVDDDPELGRGPFRTSAPTTPVDRGGGSVREVDPESRPPGPFYELAGGPEGFRRRGRYSVIPPQAENFADPSTRARIVAGVVDVWVRGADVLFVEVGGTLGGVPPFSRNPTSSPVDLGSFGEGELFVDARGNQVRVALDGGDYVRITGTLPPDRLAAIARSMEPVEGGELEFVD